MMFQESVDTKMQSLHHMMLIAALIVFVQDLSSGGGAQAWTYNYSTSPNRRYPEARQWCQQHFTDMVPIRNQEESDFINNLLPFNSKYYWINVVKKGGEWIREGEKGEKVPEEAQNWAPEEPDDIAGQDCVEIYIKRDKETAKWNNESCRKRKGTACYTASCKQDSCSANADCVETVGGYTCQCHPGFQGSRCEEVKKCSPVFFPVTGNVTCVYALEPFSFGSRCNFTCQEGYYQTRDNTFTCLASGQWSNPTPTCTVVQCNSLQAPPHAAMQCQGPIGVNSYGSICTVRCEEGFDVIGTNMTKCSSQGNWSHELPVCKAKRCNPINPPHGSPSCFDPNGPFSFGSLCSTTCEEGFLLNGTASAECTSLGMWSTDIPRCLAKRCPAVNSSSHGSLVCSDPHDEFSFGSRCTSTCEEGFVLNGTVETECTFQGMWSTDIPRCLAKRCPTLNSSSHGSFICSDPHDELSFGSRCTSTCEEGFVLNGTADTECTSLGMWSTDIPLCLAERCPSLNSSSHGSFFCSDPHDEFSFGSRCTSTCEEGFLLNGTADTECTSLGTWSTEIPHCLAQPCPLLAEAPQHGRMNCSHPYSSFSYGSLCDVECTEGFWLRGTPTVTCNNSGNWSQDLPMCQPVQCRAINALSSSLSMNCSHPLGNFSFGSRCLFSCEDGFSLNGTEELFCSSTGFWNASLPYCREDMPMGTALLLYTGVGAASAVLPLVLIGLALLIIMRFKKRGKTSNSYTPGWTDRENPVFGLET
ncbi:P-selectin isoform X1 [Sebastes fasciatus]|uniref:P-selectin isoform X1 n=1 Tax=Sebastes fasciatus TaxID=394691 RepID=UPI003D9F8AEB